jgi:hypothetical protein
MKMYKTPPQRRRKKNDTEDEEGILREELNHRHLAKDIHNNQANSVSTESLCRLCCVEVLSDATYILLVLNKRSVYAKQQLCFLVMSLIRFIHIFTMFRAEY